MCSNVLIGLHDEMRRISLYFTPIQIVVLTDWANVTLHSAQCKYVLTGSRRQGRWSPGRTRGMRPGRASRRVERDVAFRPV